MFDEFVSEITAARGREVSLYIGTIKHRWDELVLQIDVHEMQKDGFCKPFPFRSWLITCHQVLASKIDDFEIFSAGIWSDHPLLWQFSYQMADLYFSSAPENAYSILAELMQATDKIGQGWLPLTAFLNYKGKIDDIIALLQSGSGLLASGPPPVINGFQKVLHLHNCRPAILGGWALEDPVPQQVVDGSNRVLILESSYIVAESFTFEQSTGGT